jgi:lauroyl/myristoyl acyltransferase
MRYTGLIDDAAREAAFGGIDQSKGALLVTFHGAMTGLNRKLFNEVFENRATLENAEASSAKSISTRDPRAALFAAMRLLLGGKSLLMAPDGRKGNRDQFGELTGKSVRTANGAALLAFETRCFCAWLNIVPEGRRLVPMVVEAPKPQKGERFEDFAERWTAFYWSQVEALLTGDPDRISLRGSLWGTLAAWDK